jgi:DNA-binding SARP family transcriptional activator
MARSTQPLVDIRLLGPVEVVRGGEAVALPRSRKVRALLALLALERTPQTRSRLCDLLWDVPNDPRGELRWCLSKLRAALDTEDVPIIIADANTVTLDRRACMIDALELDHVLLATAETAQLSALADRITGELLDGMQLDGAELNAWLLAHRQRLRALHIALLRELAQRAPAGSEESQRRIEAWLRRAPLDAAAHLAMIDALVRAGRVRDAEEHVNTAIRAFEHEGVDWEPLRTAWHAARPVIVTQSAPVTPIAEPRAARRGSVAVMPFSSSPDSKQVADGLTDDIITRLAKLRLLFVIARGTTYALRDRGLDAREAGRILDVEYIVNGSVRHAGTRLAATVELAEAQTARIVWSDTIESSADDPFSVLDSIVNRIVSAVAEEIERTEVKRAILKPPSSLDAWEAYHRGLWHMYRFTGPDNETSARYFREALRLDPLFARAHAGLSFTHFQNVFLELTPDRDNQLALALETAGQSLAADDRDPAAHWAMGRALWLRGEQHESIVELERSVELSPNFALGHYTLGFVHAQSGDPETAIDAADYSRQLSPFDPLTFGMLGSRAIAHMRLGEREEAADWGVRAASRPNAHAHILAIAATGLSLANRRDQARATVARIRERLPAYTIENFLRAFRLEPEAEAIIRAAAKQIDLG